MRQLLLYIVNGGQRSGTYPRTFSTKVSFNRLNLFSVKIFCVKYAIVYLNINTDLFYNVYLKKLATNVGDVSLQTIAAWISHVKCS